MGFITLFQRRNKLEKALAKHPPKSQPYDDTIPSLPPLRGIFPVAGNGPSVIDSLSRSTKFSSSHLSLTEATAPLPVTPRFKEESSERPSTAPNGSPIGVQQGANWFKDASQKRMSLKAPPVSLKKATPQFVPPAAAAPRPPGYKPLPAPPLKAPSAHAHSRTFSMRSDASPAFVDLLDAQSEINPADFRSRVRAAGARDYGEDVADRNIGVNGVDLHSTQVKEFYASDSASTRLKPTNPDLHFLSGGGASRRSHMGKPASMESGLRTKSLSSSSFTFPKRTSSAVPAKPSSPLVQSTPANTSRPVTGSTSRAMRRQSVNTYLSSPSSDVMSSAQEKLRPKSFHRSAVPADHGLHISPGRANLHAPGWDTTSPESVASPPVVHAAKLAPSPRVARDSAISVSRPRTGTTPSGSGSELSPAPAAIVPTDGNFQFSFLQGKEQPSSTPRPRSSHRGSVASPTLSRRQQAALHTIHSSISSSIASRETPTNFTPLYHPHPRSAARQHLEVEEVDVGRDAAPSPYVKSSHTRNDSRDEIYGYSRAKSLTSLSLPRPSFDGAPEDVPPRTSSIRHWSMTSATPTTSSASSRTFPRSMHTANTSVDFSTVTAFGPNGGRPSSSSGSAYRQSFSTARESFQSAAPAAKAEKKKPLSPGFNIDDYLSSDDDDFAQPARPRGEGEEALLFSEATFGGLDGMALPGLGDAAPAPDVHKRHTPRSSMSFPAESLRYAYASPLSGAGPLLGHGRRYIIDTALDYDFADAASEAGTDATTGGGYSTDGTAGADELSAGGMGHARRAGSGVYGYSSVGGQVIEEERLEKVDVAAAVRARKEAKARKRAGEAGLHRRSVVVVPAAGVERERERGRGKGKGKMVVVDDEGGWNADVE